MNRLILALACLLVATFSIKASDIDESMVPANVRAYVNQHYPNATHKEWDIKNKKHRIYYYKVEFYVEGREVKLKIDNAGNVMYLKEHLRIADIPTFAQNYINKNYANATVIGVKKVIEDGLTYYDVGIRFTNNYGNGRNRNLHFDTKGNVIKG